MVPGASYVTSHPPTYRHVDVVLRFLVSTLRNFSTRRLYISFTDMFFAYILNFCVLDELLYLGYGRTSGGFW